MSTPIDHMIAIRAKHNLAINPALNNAQTVSVELARTLPSGELTKIYHSIESRLTHTEHRVVQFISAYDVEGTSKIGFETALNAASLGKRVLFIDTDEKLHQSAQVLAQMLTASLDTVVQSDRPLGDALVFDSTSNLFYAAFDEQNVALANIAGFKKLLDEVRPSFDLIVINSSNILGNVFGLAISRIVDGSILVVEAEKTRAPVAQQVQKIVGENGGRLIGAVLNKRRLYIPRWLYRLLYRNHAF